MLYYSTNPYQALTDVVNLIGCLPVDSLAEDLCDLFAIDCYFLLVN